jgi:geranylgeranyl diphosphate synthase type II
MGQRKKSPEFEKEFDIQSYLSWCAKLVDKALNKYLPTANTKPATLHQAMRYSVFAGGKRIRPALCIAASLACGGDVSAAIPLACAVECIHTYSLIHDDLPAMDNDDFRRGKPTNHKVFGEAIAILAGDALLARAFEIASTCDFWPRYPHNVIIRELAVASGSKELVAGQTVDIQSEGKSISIDELKFIHEKKTSALLCCAVRLGGMSAQCTELQLKALTKFGHNVGLAFQVIDDILDVTQTSDKLGKTAGKDIQSKKATYPALLGLDKSKQIAKQLTARAFKALEPFKEKGKPLHALAQFLLDRTY